MSARARARSLARLLACSLYFRFSHFIVHGWYAYVYMPLSSHIIHSAEQIHTRCEVRVERKGELNSIQIDTQIHPEAMPVSLAPVNFALFVRCKRCVCERTDLMDVKFSTCTANFKLLLIFLRRTIVCAGAVRVCVCLCRRRRRFGNVLEDLTG